MDTCSQILRYTILLLIWNSSVSLFAQERCLQTFFHNLQQKHNPDYMLKHEYFEQEWSQYSKGGSRKKMDSLLTLPVVFHIIHQNGPALLSNNRILQELQNLNEAFSNIGAYDPSIGATIGINFCLATRLPSGLPTEGIFRVESPLTNLNTRTGDFDLKKLSRLDPLEYINIYIVNEICIDDNCAPAGYAYLPFAHGNSRDGIVVQARSVGISPERSTVLIHEMGHYLGLYHTFQGACRNDDCSVFGDRVCDTPPDNTTVSTPCDFEQNSCATDSDDTSAQNPYRTVAFGGRGDQNDNIENYMDYSNIRCQKMFSEGQKERMQFFLSSVRSSLLDSKGCLPPCSSPIVSLFNASDSVIFIDQSINFINQSINANNFDWLVNGESTSSSKDFTYTFPTTGSFEITLVARNDNDACLPKTYRQNVQVNCTAESVIQTTDTIFTINTVASFSTPNSNVQWFVNGQLLSDSSSLSFQPTQTGNTEVCLVTDSGSCKDSSCMILDVIDPDEDCDQSYVNQIIDTVLTDFQSLLEDDNGNIIMAGIRFDERRNTFVPNIITLNKRTGNILSQASLSVSDFSFTQTAIDAQGFVYAMVAGNYTNQVNSPGSPTNGLIKFNPQTYELIWSKSFDRPVDVLQMIIEPNSGDLLLCGQSERGAILFRLDHNSGNIIWAHGSILEEEEISNPLGRYLDITLFENQIYAVGINSAFVFSGVVTLNRSSIVQEIFDLNGNIVSTRRARTRGSFFARARIVALPSGVIIAFDERQGNFPFGFTDARIKLLTYNSFLNFGWVERTIGLSQFDNPTLLDFQPTNDGALLFLSGRDNSRGQGMEETGIVEINGAGEITFSNSYLSFLFNQSYGRKIITNSDGYFFHSGNGLIIKTNQRGFFDQGSRNCTFSTGLFASSAISTDLQYDRNLPLIEFEPTFNLVPNNWQLFSPLSNSTTTEYGCTPIICCTNDLVVSVDTAICAGDSLMVSFYIKNEGLTRFDNQINISLYDKNPSQTRNSKILKTINLASQALNVGDSILVTSGVPFPEDQLYVFLNDPGNNRLPLSLAGNFLNVNFEECNYENNLDSFSYESPILTLDLGPDTTICENSTVSLDAGPGFFRYEWSDATGEQIYTTYDDGIHWVRATTLCGETLIDTLLVEVDTMIDLMADPTVSYICPGDTAQLTVTNLEDYNYTFLNETGAIICENCSSLAVSPIQTTTYSIIATNENGCISTDSLVVNLISCDQVVELEICPDDSTNYQNKLFFVGDIDTVRLNLDTIQLVRVKAISPLNSFESLNLCQEDSLNLFGEYIFGAGSYTANFTSKDGCDSTHTVSVSLVDIPEAFIPDGQIDCLDSTGFLEVQITNGLAPYVIDWSNGAQSEKIEGLESGSYSVTVKDQNDCITTALGMVPDTIPILNAIIERNDAACFGENNGSINIINVSGGTAPYLYRLDQQSYTQEGVFPNLDVGNYTLNIVDNNNCSLDELIVIAEPDPLQIDPLRPIILSLGDTTLLNPNISANRPVQFSWLPFTGLSCTDCSSTLAYPTQNTSYQFQIEDGNGCKEFIEIQITVDATPRVFIPNVFSPNNDQVNDFFGIFAGNDVSLISNVQLFSRWGQIIFDRREIIPAEASQLWDGQINGQAAPSDIYVYTIEVLFKNQESRIYKGSVKLLR